MSEGLQLLAAVVHKGDIAQYQKLALTEQLFFGSEQPLFAYINGHFQKHNVLPKPETVFEQFGKMPKPVEPVTFYMGHVLNRYKFKTVNRMLTECSEPMKKQDPDAALKLVAKALSDLQADRHYSGEKPLGSFVMSDPELLGKEFPKREMIVSPFLPTASLAMVYAATGVGKTWFSLQLALSVSQGEKFFKWDVPKPRRVLYVDGELPSQDIQARRRDLYPKPLESLKFLPCIDMRCEGVPLNLNEPRDQSRMDEYLASLPVEQKPSLIVFDNRSSLATGKDESSNSDLDSLLLWLMKLRGQGYAVLVVHHAGKDESKGQRGASRRTDLLNTVIKLAKRTPTQGKGVCFEVTFDKLRGEMPEPASLTVELDTKSELVAIWHTSATGAAASDAATPAYLQTLRVIRDEGFKTQKEIAEYLEITEGAVSKHVAEAREEDMLQADKLKLTKKGMTLLNEKFPKEIYAELG